MSELVSGLHGMAISVTPAAPTGRHVIDPPLPLWDGKDPVRGWRQWKRTVFLWEADSDILEERRGTTDDPIRVSDGVRNITKFFDDHCAPDQNITDHEDFNRAVYGYEGSSTETYMAYFTKKRELFQRHEKALIGDRLPDLFKAKVVPRSSLTEQAYACVHSLTLAETLAVRWRLLR